MMAGEIPDVGDFVMSRGWCFEIIAADDKKILQVKAEELICNLDDDDFCDEDDASVDSANGSSTNPIQNLMRRVKGGKSSGSGSEATTESLADDDTIEEDSMEGSDESMMASNGEMDDDDDDDDDDDEDEEYSNRKSSLLKDAKALLDKAMDDD